LATAVLEKLHRSLPEVSIDFLVRKGNETLLANHPFLNACLVWDKTQNKYKNLWKMLRKVRLSNYDAVINLQRFANSGIITAFSGAKERIGFDKNPFSFLFTKKIPHQIGSKQHPGDHEVVRCLKTIEHLTDTNFQRPVLYPTVEDFAHVQEFIQVPFLTFSPASVWFTKKIPIKVWKEMLDVVSPKRVILLGGKADVSLCNDLAGDNAHVTNLSGKLSLLQSAALMKSAEMNFTGDSAPLHLCSAMNAPVTAIFCSTIPEFGFGPLSDISFVKETKENLDCRPCGLHGFQACPQGHFKCSLLLASDILNA
jgi:ADP-heptose:LPS heptosyltransferase